MKFPSADRYNEAVQNPAVYFLDSDIRRRHVQTDALGLPEVLSGGFAFTYRFAGTDGDIAVRCFHREIPELLERYKAIGAFLARLHSRFFVDFAFVGRGVRLDGSKLPIVRMQWVEGETLLGYVARRRADAHALGRLREQILAFAEEGERSGYAHGDVQHRNFMVTPRGELKLVDYDGMYVPALRHLRAADSGHPHFQPPARTAADFGPRMDRFPLAVLDLSMEALQEAPGLFDKFHRGENLILSRDDFVDPTNSPALAAMARIPRLAPRVAAFSDLCGLPVREMVPLREFRAMSGSAAVVASFHRSPTGPQTYTSPFDVVDGMDYAAACRFVGRPVELVGRVGQVKTDPARACVLLRFGARYAGTPAVLVPLDAFLDWEGKDEIGSRPWISAIGVLQTHRSGRHSSVQLLVKETSDIEVLTGREEAEFRLGRASRAAPASPAPKAAVPPAPQPVTPPPPSGGSGAAGHHWIRPQGAASGVPSWLAGGAPSGRVAGRAAPVARGPWPISQQGQARVQPTRHSPSPASSGAQPISSRLRAWIRRLLDEI